MITDYASAPMIFNVQDLIDSIGTQKYFSNFNIEEYIVNLTLPNNFPVFIDLVDSGSGGGLQTGQYAYAISYATATGDATAPSCFTPLIFVPEIYDRTSVDQFPGLKRIGGVADALHFTKYGIKIKFRIDNRLNFATLKIMRVKYNGGEVAGFIPNIEIIKTIPLAEGQFEVYEYTDNVSNSEATPDTVTFAEQGYLSAIKRAKGIRYFNRRAVLMNVEYESRDATGITFGTHPNDGTEIVPITEDISYIGYKDALNHTYKRGYMNGEAYGFGIAVRDSFGQIAFVVPVPNFDSYRFPNRRDLMTADSIANSVSPVVCAAVDSSIDETYEVWSLMYPDSTNRPAYVGSTASRNIMNTGDIGITGEAGNAVGYLPFTPKSPSDIVNNYKDIITNIVSGTSYNPYVFRPTIHPLGISLAGIQNLPSWASSLSVVRTRRANKVIVQGIGYYSYIEIPGEEGSFATTAGGGIVTGKEQKELWCHFPDINNGGVNPSVLDDIIENPSDYEVQLVSPYGITADTHNMMSAGEAPLRRFKQDVLLYGRVMVEDDDNARRINPIGAANTHGYPSGNKGYIGYGLWKNSATIPAWVGVGDKGNTRFTFNAGNPITKLTQEENFVTYQLNFNEDIYSNSVPTSGAAKEMFEPIYVLNIIQLGKEVPDNNITEYIDTGCHIKIRSVISVSDGSNPQNIDTIDERLEDFNAAFTGGTPDKFIYVKVNGVEQRYICLNNHFDIPTQLDTILDDYLNSATNYDGSRIYGFYFTSGATGRPQIQFHSIVHPVSAATVNSFPPNESEVIVKYNDDFPINCFGGDTFIGDAIFPILHRHNQDFVTPDSNDTLAEAFVNTGFPNNAGTIDDRVFIPANEPGGGNPDIDIHNNWDFFNNWIRQLILVYNCQSYSHLALSYGDYFPVVNYVQRPNQYDATITPSANDVFDQYETDYPNEELRWHLGGFHIEQFPINLDYSKEPNYKKFQSKPKTGFTENNHFCDRVIWSLARLSNDAVAPSLRTFLPFNFYDITDHYGQIKYAYDFTTLQRGNNLYAITERGIALLVTEKRILSNLSAEELSIVGQGNESQFISDHIFLEKHQGVPEELWRSIAEFDDGFIFASNEGVFFFDGNQVQNIDNNYKEKLWNRFIKNLDTGYKNKIVSINDRRNDEYWLQIQVVPIALVLVKSTGLLINPLAYGYRSFKITVTPDNNTGANVLSIEGIAGTDITVQNKATTAIITIIQNVTAVGIVNITPGQTVRLQYNGTTWTVTTIVAVEPYDTNMVFSRKTKLTQQDIGRWIGEFDYRFDKYVSFFDRTYGSKLGRVYKLHEGYLINGSPINYEMHHVVNIGKDEEQGKEFVRLRANTKRSVKPVRFDFCDIDFDTVVGTVAAADMRDYIGIEQYIPRHTNAPNDRQQGTHLLYKIIHNLESEFVLRSVNIKYLNLK